MYLHKDVDIFTGACGNRAGFSLLPGCENPRALPMGNIGDLAAEFDPLTLDTAHSGIGTVTTLPMSEDEREKAHERPIGFIWPQE